MSIPLESIEKLTIAKLKPLLAERNLPITGNKKALVERLTLAINNGQNDAAKDVDTEVELPVADKPPSPKKSLITKPISPLKSKPTETPISPLKSQPNEKPMSPVKSQLAEKPSSPSKSTEKPVSPLKSDNSKATELDIQNKSAHSEIKAPKSPIKSPLKSSMPSTVNEPVESPSLEKKSDGIDSSKPKSPLKSPKASTSNDTLNKPKSPLKTASSNTNKESTSIHSSVNDQKHKEAQGTKSPSRSMNVDVPDYSTPTSVASSPRARSRSPQRKDVEMATSPVATHQPLLKRPRSPSPISKNSSNGSHSLHLRPFTRPLNLIMLKSKLSSFGPLKEFWIDNKRSHCLVTYEKSQDAASAREDMNGVIFQEGFEHLVVGYVNETDFDSIKSSDGSKVRPSTFIENLSNSLDRNGGDSKRTKTDDHHDRVKPINSTGQRLHSDRYVRPSSSLDTVVGQNKPKPNASSQEGLKMTVAEPVIGYRLNKD
ncbi:hypothetical protein BC833DRAFT_242253 [Globomyces pollinis-pini]|nr:hypothetical protein BC833DRAFT_242253 [Globomyces pollinis-pini]